MSMLDDQAREAAKREQFIPLRKGDLAEKLVRGSLLPASEVAEFRRFCRRLHLLVHGQFQAALEELKDVYAPFDPDAETRSDAELSATQLDALRGRLFDKFAWLLARGNFKRLAAEEINRALEDRSHWGLHLKVDFELFDRLELYARGDTVTTRYRRRLAKGFRPEEVPVAIYQRLVVIFRLRPGERFSKVLDTQDVYIKLFKEIPKLDLEMLLPETKVRMSTLDRLRVSLPTVTGIGMAVVKMFAIWSAGLSLAFLAVVGARSATASARCTAT